MGLLKGLAIEYLRLWRLLLWVLMVLLAHGVVGVVLGLAALVDGVTPGQIEPMLVRFFEEGVWIASIYATVAGTWWYFLSVARQVRTRACCYALPVPWWFWGAGSGVVVLICCLFAGLLASWRVSYWAMPAFVAAYMAALELIARCVPVPGGSARWRALVVLALVGLGGLWYREMAMLSGGLPQVVFVLGGLVAAGVPFAGGRLALRRWRAEHGVERNQGFQPVGLERLCLEGMVAGRRGGVIEYPAVGRNLWVAATALVGVMLPAYRWGPGLLLRVVLIRALFWAAAILLMTAGMFQLELLDDGYDEAMKNLRENDGLMTFLMVPLLVVTYIGGLIDSGRAIGMQTVMLGRDASRAVVRRACFGLAVASVLPVMLAVFLAEWAVALYLGTIPDGEVMVVLFVQCCVLLSIAPMAIVLLINKRATAGGANPLRVVGSMLAMAALMMALSFAVPNSPGAFLATAAVLLVTGWWQVGLYLRWYYGTRNLVVR